MPVRDGEAYLERALASLQAQTLTRWELVVVDDGSTDDTAAILARAAAVDPRVRVFRHEASGLVPSLQRAAREAVTPLLARMDADDEARPARLAHQVAALDADAAVVAVGGSFEVVDGSGTVVRTEAGLVGPGDVARELFVRNPFAHGSVTMRREQFEAVGGYHDEHPAAEDYDLWVRLAQTGDLVHLPEVVYRWRAHDGGVTHTRASQQAESTTAVRNRLWAAGNPALRRRVELRRAVAVNARVPGLGPLLVDRYRQVELALVVARVQRGDWRAAGVQFLHYLGHGVGAPGSVVVFALSGMRFTSARRLVDAVRSRARARVRPPR